MIFGEWMQGFDSQTATAFCNDEMVMRCRDDNRLTAQHNAIGILFMVLGPLK